MVDLSAIDVEIGWYDRAPVWVDYAAGGMIATRPTRARLHAVIHFHPDHRLPDLPMGVLPVAAGGLFQSKQTTYQVVVGRERLAGISYPDPAGARHDVWFRALKIATGALFRVPEAARWVVHVPAFQVEGAMCSVRCYGNYLDAERQVMLHSVVHYDRSVGQPAVPFMVRTQRRAGMVSYHCEFAPDGARFEELRAFPTDDEANGFLAFAIPSLAGAFYSMAMTKTYGALFEGISDQARVEAGFATPQEAQEEYETVLRLLRSEEMRGAL